MARGEALLTQPAAPRATPDAALGEATAIVGVALATTALPVMAHLGGQGFGLLVCVVLAGLVARSVPAAVPATLLSGFLFQNLALSIVSPWLDGADDFASARAYNFVSTLVIWAILSASYWTAPRGRDQSVRRIMLASSVVLALVLAYFVLGATSDLRNAAVYLRNVAMPFLVFQACLIAAVRSPAPLTRGLAALGVMILAYGYAELLVREQLFPFVHGDTYLGYSMRQQIDSPAWLRELRETGRVIRGLDDMLTFDLFNTALLSDLKIRLYRLQGPNFHAISYAYALAAMSLLRLAQGRPLYLVAALPLLVVIGSKGAMLVCLVGCLGLLATSATRSPLVLPVALAGLAAFSLVAIVVGLAGGDYHVIGLFGGLNGFFQNPFGRGLGIGGNLATDMSQVDWNRAQALGRTETALESAVGTILYQMGVAGLAVCLAPFVVAAGAFRAAIAAPEGRLLAVSAFALAAVGAAGLLQEEALFAPLAFGTCMLLAALALGSPGATLRTKP